MKKYYERKVDYKTQLEPIYENHSSGSEQNRPYRLNIIRTIVALRNPARVIYDIKKDGHPANLNAENIHITPGIGSYSSHMPTSTKLGPLQSFKGEAILNLMTKILESTAIKQSNIPQAHSFKFPPASSSQNSSSQQKNRTIRKVRTEQVADSGEVS
ncbi:hypothetical protein FGO68_gene13415 [Halteria grandinella]|uniref:Uncharacterized protein n=1 Tax=Halteria grandinella TaxID=5974 RepID=A0A8J8SWZ7_HALGN|nr:hypothetical protein FGO68_gene13415 [Halteria grandinella]